MNALVISSLTATLIGTMASAQERQTVNELGGIGVDQSYSDVAGTPNGALLIFDDDRSGDFAYRIQTVDAYGNPGVPSLPIEQILEPVNGFSYSPELLANLDSGTAYLKWRTWNGSSYVYKMVEIDTQSGQPVGYPATLPTHDQIFISNAGGYILLNSVEVRLEAQLLDAAFLPVGDPFVVADDSGHDFPDQISEYDVAFDDDGSFIVTWAGHFPPYFDQIKSRRFQADGTPDGPENEHTNEEGIFFPMPKVDMRGDGVSLVTWTDDVENSLVGQEVDAAGYAIGVATTLLDSSSLMAHPEMIHVTDQDDWVVISRNGMAAFEAGSLGNIDTASWSQSTYTTKIAWMEASQNLLVTWPETSSTDADDDILGMLQAFSQAPVDLGSVSDDVDGAHQKLPSIAASDDGRSIIAWIDYRNSGHGNIAFQAYDQNGQPVGENQFLSTPGRHVATPQVAMNNAGEFVISWIERSSSSSSSLMSLKARRFDANYQQVGSTITIYTEEGSLLSPIFGVIGSTFSDKRHLHLMDNGNLFATWGLMIVTGGTIGNPQYGRTDLFTKAYTPSNVSYSASSNQVIAGAVHGLVPTSEHAVQVLYYSTTSNQLQMLEFAANGSGSSNGALGDIGGFDNLLDDDLYMSIAGDIDGFSISWAAYTAGIGDRAYTAHYDGNGDLILAEMHDESSVIAMTSIAPNGTRVVLYGSGNDMHVKQYDVGGQAITGSEMIATGENYDIDWWGVPVLEMAIVGDEMRLARHVGSGTDQGNDIELTAYEIDITTCATGDFNCDGLINGQDLGYLLGHWGLDDADLNGDGTTNGADLTILLGGWAP